MAYRKYAIIIALLGIVSVGLLAGVWYLFDQGYVMINWPERSATRVPPVVDQQMILCVVSADTRGDTLVDQSIDLVIPAGSSSHSRVHELVKAWFARMQSLQVIPDRCRLQEVCYGAQSGDLMLTLTHHLWHKQASARQRFIIIQSLCATLDRSVPGSVRSVYLMHPDGTPLMDDVLWCGEPFNPAHHGSWPYISEIYSTAPRPIHTILMDIPPFVCSQQGRYVADVSEHVLATGLCGATQERLSGIAPVRIVSGQATGNLVSHAHVINRMRGSMGISCGFYQHTQLVPRISIYLYGMKPTDGWRLPQHPGNFMSFTQVHRASVPMSMAYARGLHTCLTNKTGVQVQIDDIAILPIASLVGRDHPSVYIEIGIADTQSIPQLYDLLSRSIVQMVHETNHRTSR